jgi:DNA-binding NarL/FixJ family response regulator
MATHPGWNGRSAGPVATPASASTPPAERPVSVVLVEDHPGVREQLAALLTGSGITVLRAVSTAAEGHQAVIDLRPDVAVLDHNLPDGSGVDLCRRLTEVMPGLPVLIHTGAVTSALVERAMAAGASAVLPKSVRGEALVRAIRARGAQAQAGDG